MANVRLTIAEAATISGWEAWDPIFLKDDIILYHGVLLHMQMLEHQLRELHHHDCVTKATHRDYTILSICLDNGILPITTMQAEEMLRTASGPHELSQLLHACTKIVDDIFNDTPLLDVQIKGKRVQFSFLSRNKVTAISTGRIKEARKTKGSSMR